MSIQDLETNLYVQLTVCEEKLTQCRNTPNQKPWLPMLQNPGKLITAITPAIALSTASPQKAIAFCPRR